MKTKITTGIILLLSLAFIIPANAQLGSQSFGKSNFRDDIITQADIEAAHTTFSNPGILPDNPLYFFKRIKENVQLMFTFDNEQKARLHLELAKTRLAEAARLAEQNKPNSASINEFNNEVKEFNFTVSGIGRNISDVMKDGTDLIEKSNIVINYVISKPPGSTIGVKHGVRITNKINIGTNEESDREVHGSIGSQNVNIGAAINSGTTGEQGPNIQTTIGSIGIP